ncbi:hypothetical protein [Natrinema sp. 1APR25-10V2]|uniref:hypothetical protein n=1 Tax=Natrinema sp. 1APR25-10V2 TaxID=2951081 RepID=UPI0028749D9A|nr:hypothetical protein [Natrinema sp. 1APR25-10V2]MDS0478667.1 hypothetical protein [Natrinema sp. 1APR25-10V2]
MTDDEIEVPPIEEGTDELLSEAEEIDSSEGMTVRMHQENRLVGRSVDYIAEWSEEGEISSANANALADALSSELAHYTKTDIKSEFKQVFVDGGSGSDGIPFDELIENRLEEVKMVSTTDAKQGLIWRWHFSDGVQLETEKSKDDGRKHYDWNSWKEDYFEALLSLGKGEEIAPPTRDRRDSNDWKAWISSVLLEKATTVEHVGPRTEAVELLRDFVNRQVGFSDVKDMRDRQGIWMDAPPVEHDGEAATDGGGPTEIRIPTQAVKRVCDQAGIETRALQIELDAREHTVPETTGVSDYEFVDGQRVSFWRLDADFAEPVDFVEEPASPAEQVAREQEEAAEETRTDVGAVTEESEDASESDGADEDEDTPAEPENDDESPDTADEPPTAPPDEPLDESRVDGETDDFDTGVTDGFGVDPDEEGGE